MTRQSGQPSCRGIRAAWGRGALVAAVGAITIIGASGCARGPAPVVETSRPIAPTPTAVLVPGGTAQQNLPFFNSTNEKTVAANPAADSHAFIDGLVAAGFAKVEMEVTADQTSVNLPVASVQFSVRVGPSCLIGQYGPDSDGYHGVVTPVLGTGKCLVGDTISITW